MESEFMWKLGANFESETLTGPRSRAGGLARMRQRNKMADSAELKVKRSQKITIDIRSIGTVLPCLLGSVWFCVYI